MSASSTPPDQSQPGLTTRTAAQSGDRLVLRVEGELDLSTVDQFAGALDDALEAEPGEIVLDLRDLHFIDSSGVGAYVTAYRRARSRQVRLRIGDRSPAVARVLELSGVEEALRAETESAESN